MAQKRLLSEGFDENKDGTDDLVRTRLMRSYVRKQQLMRLLKDKGLWDASLPPFHWRRQRRNGIVKALEPDITLWPASAAPIRLSVKVRLGMKFTGPADYPRDTCYVDEIRSWERRGRDLPYATLLVTEYDPIGIVVIPTDTKKTWQLRLSHDRRYHNDIAFLEAPRSVCRDLPWFINIVQHHHSALLTDNVVDMQLRLP